MIRTKSLVASAFLLLLACNSIHAGPKRTSAKALAKNQIVVSARRVNGWQEARDSENPCTSANSSLTRHVITRFESYKPVTIFHQQSEHGLRRWLIFSRCGTTITPGSVSLSAPRRQDSLL